MSVSISTYCVVFGCPNKGSSNILLSKQSSNRTVTFHRFPPKRPEASLTRHKKWLKNINRENFVPKQGSVVCSLHFTPDLFLPRGRLLGCAVPTLYMGSPPKYDKLLADKGVQCEMGKETYRSQPGVKIVTNQDNEEFGDENNPGASTPEDPSPVNSNAEELECSPMVRAEDIKKEDDISMSAGDFDSFVGVQCNVCTCGECGSGNSGSISICCDQMELEDIKYNQAGNHNCITFDENFVKVVLDIHVIMTRLHTMILRCPPENVEYANLLKSTVDNRLCRHVAYQQFRSWINSRFNFGIDLIKMIPTCVVNLVRQKFPEDDNVYQQLLSNANNSQESKFEYFD